MEEKTYTLDELKSEVDKFRDYLLKVEKKSFCMINVEFITSKTMEELYGQRSVETRISIF